MSRPNLPLDLGDLVATPGALTALGHDSDLLFALLHRHQHGDWGHVPPSDARLNDAALEDGSRVMSAYGLSTGDTIWIITEATDDQGRRSHTTVLLPEEY